MKNGPCKAFAKRLLQDTTRPADRAANVAHAANCPDCQARQAVANRLERMGAEARNRDLSDAVLRDTRLRAAEILAEQAQHASGAANRLPVFGWPWAVASLALILAFILRFQPLPPGVETGSATLSATVIPSDMDRDILALQHRLALDMKTFGYRHLAPQAQSRPRNTAGRLRSQLDRLAFSMQLDMPDAMASASFMPGGTP